MGIEIKCIDGSESEMLHYWKGHLCGNCYNPLPVDKHFFIISVGDEHHDIHFLYLCPHCVNLLHLATAPLQILVTTGKATES